VFETFKFHAHSDFGSNGLASPLIALVISVDHCTCTRRPHNVAADTSAGKELATNTEQESNASCAFPSGHTVSPVDPHVRQAACDSTRCDCDNCVTQPQRLIDVRADHTKTHTLTPHPTTGTSLGSCCGSLRLANMYRGLSVCLFVLSELPFDNTLRFSIYIYI
jgi:hypothetical protein